MVQVVRESKFRHVYGYPHPKDQQFEGVIASGTRMEANLCACNVKFVAVVLKTTGAGVFTVLDRTKTGRLNNIYRCTFHSSEILDLSFDNFNSNRVVSGADDGCFAFWYIPDGGLSEDLSEPLGSIKASHKRAIQALWHTSASDIVFLVNADLISVYELKTCTSVLTIETKKYCDTIFCASLNGDSTKIACTFKDKMVRVFNTHKGDLLNEFAVTDSPKPSRVVFVYGLGDKVCTTQFTRSGDRSISVWDLDSTDKPIHNEDIDRGVSVLNVYYDHDTSLVCVYGKGESSVKIFELDTSGTLYSVSTFQQGEQQKTACFAEKLACNAANNEIMHFLKVTNKGVEPVSFIVPRKSELFQEDLFPDTNSNVAAMTCEDFIKGKVCQPLKLSMKDFSVSSCVGQTSVQMTSVNSTATKMKEMPQGGGVSLSDLLAKVKDLEERVSRLEGN